MRRVPVVKFRVDTLDGVFIFLPFFTPENSARTADRGGRAIDEGRAQKTAADRDPVYGSV